MGNTCAKTTRKKEKLPHFKSEILTHQEQVARNLQNDVIFKVVLENIKVKHIPVNSASLQVKFGKYKCLDLPEIKNIKSPHDDDGRVTFMLTVAQQVAMKLIPKEIQFELNDEVKNQNLSEDEFNVNDIDEKNNLQVPNLKGAGTINKVQDTLQNIENRKKEKGKIYRLKSQRQSHLQGLRDGTVNTSGLTQKQKQQIQQSKEKEQIKRKSTLISLSQNFQNQSNQNIENPQQLSNTIIETYDEVLDWFKIQTWNFKDLMDDDIPQVELKIFADEFASSTFYMKLWSCSENLQYLDPFSGGYNKKIGDKSIMQKRVSVLQIQKHNSMQLQRQNHNHKSNIYDDNFEEESFQTNDAYIDHEMVGHAEISMSKFISDNYSEVLTNFDKNIMLKIQTLKDLKVWHHGKNIGVCHGTFTSCHVPFFRQMYAGENGNLFKNYEQLLDAQAILVNLAKHVISYATQVDEILRDYYYNILMEIINRDELDLSNMGFESELYQAKNEENGQKKGLNIKKLKKYGKCLNEKEQQFVHNFSSLAYFRIPQFREQLLEAVSFKIKNNQDFIHEWSGASNLDDVKQTFFQSLFSWERDFYDYLKTQPRYQYHLEELEQTLQNKKWQAKFQKTGVGFYLFMGSWAKYILKVQQLKHLDLPWGVIEGYETLIKAFLYELKIRDAEHYPDSLKETSQILLLNNLHLRPFLYQEVAQGRSKGSLEIDRYVSTPSKNSVYQDNNVKQNSKSKKNYKKFSENIMPDFDVTQNSQSYKTITGEKLSDSMQSMAIPIKKMLRDISDISGQKNAQDYFSENFSSDSISDFEDYQNQKILEQGLERKYGEMSEKKDKSLKFSDHIQLTSPGHINNNHSIINQNNTQILNQNFSEKRNRKISQNLNINSAQNRKKSTENDNQLKKQIIKTHQARVLNIQNVKGKKVYQGRY
ncbi:hypothetical protein PPERSA_12564 [Pseudocohnilembus persalinus]|uniref:Uncharacterized protein n=1 Tax=Pseudocohnilembus persalinus TaxID=266149 RepID=A0A0V0QCG5_PSEPJ|nr:hypothetical protein PPERSA_12564 [Pseudocohnilembus persalinus]|eukprot:KRW99888.1 hypothetical protein PPERSA_12564 [Pseudocohnilembus persalinus]